MLESINAVHKFGGSSLKTAKRFQVVKSIVGTEPTVIVLSAIGNTTRLLRRGLQDASKQRSTQSTIDTLKKRHLDMAKNLLKDDEPFASGFMDDISALEKIYQAVTIVGHFDEGIEDFVLSYGELWSSRLTALYLGPKYRFVDAFDLLVVNKNHGHCDVDWPLTQKKVREFLKKNTHEHLVITGYTAANTDEKRVTLGFNGSDHSAAILAKALKAPKLVIWTDVNGMYSADPRVVKDAQVVPEISYHEAKELAFFGASVVHPQAMLPAMDANIPIYVRNSYEPEHQGTVIFDDCEQSTFVKGVAMTETMSLLTIRGLGRASQAKLSSKLFHALHNADIRVYAAAQASAEQSVSVVVKAVDAAKAKKIANHAFDYERLKKQIADVELYTGVSMLAIVGDSLRHEHQPLETFLSAINQAHIDIHLVARSMGARNMALVVDEGKVKEALVVAHQALFA